MSHEDTEPAIPSSESQTRILKNASFLTGAFIIQKVISFLYFIFIARRIGPTDLGLYDPIKSLIPILLIIIDLSLSAVLTREVARQPERTKEYVGNVLGVKVVLALSIMFIAGLSTVFGGFSDTIKSLLYLVGMIVALDTFTLTFFAVFRGIQNLRFEAFAIIINQLLTVSLGGVALLNGFGLKGLFFATLVGSIFNFIYSAIQFKRKLGFIPLPTWNKDIIVPFLKIAFPFALSAVLVKIFTYTDRYMLLGFTHKQIFVGWYTTAHKLTFALEFIPSAFATSLYPAMSALYISSKDELSKTFEKSMQYLMFIAVPLSIAIILLADRLVVQLYTPVFAASILPLRIMVSGLIFVFVNFPIGALLNACNRQVINTVNMGITVALNVVLNTLLIPRYAYVGSAVATLFSTTLLFVLGYMRVRGIINVRSGRLLGFLFRSLVASSIMAVAIWFIAPVLTFDVRLVIPVVGSYVQIMLYYGLLALIGVVIYTGALFVLRGVTLEDVRNLRRTFSRKVS